MNKIGIVILSLLLSMSIVGKCSADSVMIDPGHGGSDSGAISYDNTLEEKDLNLDTALAVIEELKKHGVTVYATRTDDTYVSLQNRSRMANKITDLDLFVSIHHNACENPSVNRGEVIYSVKEKESQRLAECIGKKMKQIGDMEIKIYNRYNARGTDYYSVLRNTKATSVIVEISFITSEEGVALVATPEERKQNGILAASSVSTIGLAWMFVRYIMAIFPNCTPSFRRSDISWTICSASSLASLHEIYCGGIPSGLGVTSFL